MRKPWNPSPLLMVSRRGCRTKGKRLKVGIQSFGLPPKSGPVLMGINLTTGREPGSDPCENDPDRTKIAAILRDFQADLDAGLNINQACRKAGIGTATYYRWKALQENPISNEQLRVSELESEVGRLKLLVAELALDRRMLQEALKKEP